jgi:hypothetical protein
MNANAKDSGEPIRLVFELARADHPRLYDDLIQFPKGTKRINRLRVLAYDGLLMQVGQATASPTAVDDRTGQGSVTEGGHVLTNDLFGPSISD